MNINILQINSEENSDQINGQVKKYYQMIKEE